MKHYRRLCQHCHGLGFIFLIGGQLLDGAEDTCCECGSLGVITTTNYYHGQEYKKEVAVCAQSIL